MSEPVMGGHVTGAGDAVVAVDNSYILTAAEMRAAGLTVASDE